MITLEQAKALKHGDIILHIGDSSQPIAPPKRWRINGKIKLWKRNPLRFQLPIKHGLYTHAYLTNDNCHLFNLQ